MPNPVHLQLSRFLDGRDHDRGASPITDAGLEHDSEVRASPPGLMIIPNPLFRR